MKTVFSVPGEVVSEANRRDHWAVKARRVKSQKKRAYEHCYRALGVRDFSEANHVTVTLTRIMQKGQRPFDGDNLQSAFKAVRDGISMHLGIDDGSDRMEWRYGQERGDGFGVNVSIEIAF